MAESNQNSSAPSDKTQEKTSPIKTNKICVLLKSTGNAPIMKNKKWMVEPEKTIGYITGFIRTQLKIGQTDSLFVYVNQTFAPSPDQILMNLFECFGTDGKLILYYCQTQAWG